MRTFEVGFNSIPSLVAQQNGAQPEIIVPLTQVIATDERAAIAIAAAGHADKLKKATGSNVQVIVRAVT